MTDNRSLALVGAPVASGRTNRLSPAIRVPRPFASPAEMQCLVGVDAVSARLGVLAAAARELVWLLPADPASSGAPASPASMFLTVFRQAIAASSEAVVRVVCEPGVTSSGFDRERVQFRSAPAVPLWMVVVDRRTALVPTEPGAAAVLVVSNAAVVAGLYALFESLWWTTGGAAQPDEHGLNGQEQAIINLLAQGLTDDAISRRLGVSVRTCRRVIAHLMTRLRAQSRFQAGALAHSGGWLPR